MVYLPFLRYLKLVVGALDLLSALSACCPQKSLITVTVAECIFSAVPAFTASRRKITSA